MTIRAYLDSRRFDGHCRKAIAAFAGLAAACLPLFAGPVGSGRLLTTYLPSSAHQAYAYALVAPADAGAVAGRQWIAAAERALLDPTAVDLPVDTTAALEDWRAFGAVGLRFSGSSGRRVDAKVMLAGATGGNVFVELFDLSSGHPVLLRGLSAARRHSSPAGTVYRLEWHGLKDAELLLRIQPELAFAGTISYSIAEAPLLDFPVAGHDPRSIQSGFGADRDGGRRAHRGVDIFAERGTKVTASLDSWVARVDSTPRGGNVVWLQPLYGDLRLYYAHLDTQLVAEGDFVMAGDVLGTVGNTGNAVTTPPHLHYGVYVRRRGMRGGARDPVEFLR